MPFYFKQLEIPGVMEIEPKVFGDERGFFLEAFKASDFKEAGIETPIVQVNHSRSSKGVLRGLHYQLNPRAQAKTVRVVSGEIFDVAVDVRTGSPYYGKWVGVTLSSENRKMLYIPEGFAHGFCVLSESAEMIYYCSEEYAPDCDCGILWNDPDIQVNWPISDPLLSEKDTGLESFQKAKNNFVYNG
ncbi:MAG: dTDP-4-dehydrorhamnose 3,5-epimerase [bacterium]|nr:dTDP-4-dehydrorhamnose 3,5-epimerase [bacterium]